jgi:putative membrane protein
MNQISQADRFDAAPTVSNHFAWIRTRLGLERTFMAWLRTAVSLIGFGFTIVQFFQRLQDMDTGKQVLHPEAPRDLGLALIAAGVGSLAISSWQYRQMLRYLWGAEFRPIAGMAEKPHHTPIFLAAMVMIFIGVCAFGTVFFRLM